jgi:xanthine dehydrogenase accessory factor
VADSAQPSRQLTGWPEWPDYGLVNDLLPTLEAWTAAGQRFALATLIEVHGSSPRPVGSEMAIREDGAVAGYVSGGCVEAAVAHEALAVLADGRPRMLDYGAGSPVLDVQLSCGGRIRILVRAVTDGLRYVSELRAAREARRPLMMISNLADGAMRFERISDERGPALSSDGVSFLQRHLPALRLVLVGHDPVTLSLVRLAPTVDLEVILLRPRGPEALPSDARLIRYDRRSIEAALSDLVCDAWTAVYTLTHDPDTDDAVLLHALRSPAFCVGALGSRRNSELRRTRLREAGLDAAQLARLHSPAGLYLGAATPQQIALSILGQIVESRPH